MHTIIHALSCLSRSVPRRIVWVPLAFALLPSARAQQDPARLSALSLEDLTQMQISVSSFARKDENLWQTPAAVYVISKEDIARSSASSLPDLLRTVPGLQVAQIDASNWAVSARGFNSVYASKLLVLLDGRTVYSEIYSGSHWDQIDPPLENIERIEVIRGPGAAVWGTNAVNGVINVISKAARATPGLTFNGELGRIDNALTVGYGGTVGGWTQYRVFARFDQSRPFQLQSGQKAFDGEGTFSAGTRIDWHAGAATSLTITADGYSGQLKSQILAETALPVGIDNQEHESIAGGHILARWENRTAASDRALQVYVDDQSRYELASLSRTRTFDVDYQDHHVAGPRHDLVWGGEFRLTDDHVDGAVVSSSRPDFRNYLIDTFLQDEVTIVPRHAVLILGSKLQTGTLAGFQAQPSIRLLFTPSQRQTIWAAVSRAAVAPSIQDKYVTIPLQLGMLDGYILKGALQGDPGFKPETVVAYEAGYRRRIGPSFTLDLAGFFNRNERIQSLAAGAPVFSEGNVIPVATVAFRYTNGYRARTGGMELGLSWKPTPAFVVQGGYTWMAAGSQQVDPGLVAIADAWNSPRNSLFATASYSFAQHYSLNGFIQTVSSLPPSAVFAVDPTQGSGDNVPGYTRLDLRLTRTLPHGLTLDAGGTNLLTPRHSEFGAGTGFITPSCVPRSLFLKGAWTF